jgi:hypothetical protein
VREEPFPASRSFGIIIRAADRTDLEIRKEHVVEYLEYGCDTGSGRRGRRMRAVRGFFRRICYITRRAMMSFD